MSYNELQLKFQCNFDYYVLLKSTDNMTNHFFFCKKEYFAICNYMYFDVEHGIGPQTEYQITLFKTVNV